MNRPPPTRSTLLLCAALAANASLTALIAQTPPAPTPAPAAAPAPAPVPAPVPAIPSPSAPIRPADLGKLTPLAEAPNWARLNDLSKALTPEEFDSLWTTFFTDGKPTTPPWQRDPLGISVPTGASDGSTVRIEFRSPQEPAKKIERPWRTAAELPPLNGKPVLTGLRIALDPGHIGGSFAKMEERYFTMNPQDPKEFIAEGDHVLTVAQLLKPRLEKLGAAVTFVRESNEPITTQRPADLRNAALTNLRERGIANPTDSYYNLTAPQRQNTIQWESEKLFYRVSEIHARARKVNVELKPDLVICMHLNAAPWGEDGRQQFSEENHFHVLVNGCYAPEEMRMADTRFEMLYRLFTRMNDEELPIANAVAKAMVSTTGLPPYVYMTPNAKLVSENGYVYARNLLANRIYECPVIYLEPYVMNNAEVYRRLLQGPYVGRTLVDGKLRTSLYEDYAQGIVDGLVNYYRSKRK